MTAVELCVLQADSDRCRVGYKPAQSGFSLLEALVAMAIASIALGVLYRTVGQSSKNVVDVEARAEAALVARSVLAGATFAEDLARKNAGQAGGWSWTVQVTPEPVVMSELGANQPPVKLQAARVVVDVRRDRDGAAGMAWTTWKPYRVAP